MTGTISYDKVSIEVPSNAKPVVYVLGDLEFSGLVGAGSPLTAPSKTKISPSQLYISLKLLPAGAFGARLA